MNKSYVFRVLTEAKNLQLVHKFKLEKILSNDRTTIYENSEMRLCVDKKVVRVLLFEENKLLLENLRNFFYGEKYIQTQ